MIEFEKKFQSIKKLNNFDIRGLISKQLMKKLKKESKEKNLDVCFLDKDFLRIEREKNEKEKE